MRAFLISVASSAIAAVVVAELKDWHPWLHERLLRLATRALPSNLKGRFDEEWRGHISEVPGNISKTCAAVGFVFAAIVFKVQDTVIQARAAGGALREAWVAYYNFLNKAHRFALKLAFLRKAGVDVPNTMLSTSRIVLAYDIGKWSVSKLERDKLMGSFKSLEDWLERQS